MKTILALFSLLAFSSCATVDRQAKSQLVGDWRYSDATQSCHYSFKPDGSFSGEVTRHAIPVLKFAGRWKLEGKPLNYVYLRKAFGRIPPESFPEINVIQSLTFELPSACELKDRYCMAGHFT